jgi:hypothetical protein
MRHEHLPALNKYTSQAQYDALKSIDETKSLKKLVFSGSSSRTLGALVRCAWINTFPYVEDGIKHEGWCVTEAGKHAMAMFEERLRLQKIEDDKKAQKLTVYRDCVLHAYTLERDTRARREEIEIEWKKLTDEIEEARRKVSASGMWLSNHDKTSIIYAVREQLKEKGI